MKRKRTKPMNIQKNMDASTLEETLRCLRECAWEMVAPPRGWVRSVREALGITNVELAARLGKVPQSIEDLQKSEAAGSIKLDSLRGLAEALGCKLVYAVVPPKSFDEMKVEEAALRAQRTVEEVYQSLDGHIQRKELERMLKKVFSGKPKGARK
jgi:predicted DNA-binding mobile mystery protein A